MALRMLPRIAAPALSILFLLAAGCITDADGDGYPVPADCDDSDPAVYPGAPEVCDGRDDDCDAQIDEGLPLIPFYRDADGDGFGDPAVSVEACAAPAGYVPSPDDCDDSDPDVHPDAEEQCNGLDDDCDGATDEGFDVRYFGDADADGYGSDTATSCAPLPGYAPARGDCADHDAAIHPGADDPAGDGIDQDCGGADGAQPKVGLGAGSLASMQAAIDAAEPGNTVWIGPGTYLEHDLTFRGRTIRLMSTHLAANTTIDAAGAGRGFVFANGEGPEVVLDGFTIANGSSNLGGGILVSSAGPVIRGCVIRDCQAAAGPGGGVYLADSSATLAGCTLRRNVASASYGGGAYLTQSDAVISGCIFSENRLEGPSNGAHLFMDHSSPIVSGSVFLDGPGNGGVVISTSSPTFYGCRLERNGGTAMGVYSSSLSLSRCTFIANSGGDGGALSIQNSQAAVSYSLITGNFATYSGGGAHVRDSSATFTHCTIAGNRTSGYGGGVYAFSYTGPTTVTFDASILAFNIGHNLYIAAEAGTALPDVAIENTDLYNRVGPNTNLAALPTGAVVIDPDFVDYTNDLTVNDDLHLAPGSPLKDAGDPSDPDPDGSPSELGAYGGEGADRSYYADRDGDGLYDGWEIRYDLSTGIDDANQDPDADGAVNRLELDAHTHPRLADTDGDGAADGAELTAGTDPADWYSRPGVSGVYEAQVPGDFADIQAAIDRIAWEGEISVASGTYIQDLRVVGRDATLTGEGGPSATVLRGSGGASVLTARWCRLELSGFKITGGYSILGGGLQLLGVEGTLDQLLVNGNSVSNFGGGVYLEASSPSITRCTISTNAAPGFEGGGLDLRDSSPTMQGCVIEGNYAGDFGGGVYLTGSPASITNCIIRGNYLTQEFGQGAGMSIWDSSPTVTNMAVVNNGAGGGVWLYGPDTLPTFRNDVMAYNAAFNFGVNINVFGAPAPTLVYNDLYNREGVTNYYNLSSLDPTNLTVEPGFAAYAPDGHPTDLHLAPGSPLIDAGDPALLDPDGSRSDIGAYGGPGGGWTAVHWEAGGREGAHALFAGPGRAAWLNAGRHPKRVTPAR